MFFWFQRNPWWILATQKYLGGHSSIQDLLTRIVNFQGGRGQGLPFLNATSYKAFQISNEVPKLGYSYQKFPGTQLHLWCTNILRNNSVCAYSRISNEVPKSLRQCILLAVKAFVYSSGCSCHIKESLLWRPWMSSDSLLPPCLKWIFTNP